MGNIATIANWNSPFANLRWSVENCMPLYIASFDLMNAFNLAVEASERHGDWKRERSLKQLQHSLASRVVFALISNRRWKKSWQCKTPREDTENKCQTDEIDSTEKRLSGEKKTHFTRWLTSELQRAYWEIRNRRSCKVLSRKYIWERLLSFIVFPRLKNFRTCVNSLRKLVNSQEIFLLRLSQGFFL